MTYRPPSSPWYDITTPEECFSTEAAAQAAEYRRAIYRVAGLGVDDCEDDSRASGRRVSAIDLGV